MNAMDIWIVAVGVALWLGSIVLGFLSSRERDRAWREFIDKGRHPTLWGKEIDDAS